MHRRGIDRHQESRLPNERRQRKQIRFAGKIDDRLPQPGLDLGQMRLFELAGSTGHHDIEIFGFARVLDHFRPTRRSPRIFQRAPSPDEK